jgi:nicotinamidase-related amidase
MTPEVLRRDDAVLLVIDVQEAFRDRIDDWDGIVARTRFLLDVAHVLDLPVMVTEQYPKGLGETVAELQDGIAGAEKLVKLEFSSACAPGFDDALRRLGRQQVIVCGIEAHVCVHQTVVDLVRRGNGVHLVCDAVSSRSPANRELGTRRALADGAHASSAEMALFELMRVAGTPEFKQCSALLKDLDAALAR